MRRLGRALQADIDIARWAYALMGGLCIGLGAVAEVRGWGRALIFVGASGIGAVIAALDELGKTTIGWYRRRQFKRLVLRYGNTWGEPQ